MTSAPSDAQHYANGNSYCYAAPDVADCRGAYPYACSSPDCDAQTDVLVCTHAVLPPSRIAESRVLNIGALDTVEAALIGGVPS